VCGVMKRRLLVVLEATYKRIYGQQQFGKCWCVVLSQPTLEKLSLKKFIHVKYFRMFSVYENIFTTKIMVACVLVAVYSILSKHKFVGSSIQHTFLSLLISKPHTKAAAL